MHPFLGHILLYKNCAFSALFRSHLFMHLTFTRTSSLTSIQCCIACPQGPSVIENGGSAIALPLNPLRSSSRKRTLWNLISNGCTLLQISRFRPLLLRPMRTDASQSTRREIFPLLIRSVPLSFTASKRHKHSDVAPHGAARLIKNRNCHMA